MDKHDTKILITGGHLTPAIAVLNELKNRGYHNFSWVGHKFNQSGSKVVTAEFNTVNTLDVPFYNLRTGKLIRDWSFSTFLYGIKNLFFVLWGIISAFYLILKLRPNIIVSFGGYLALPVVISGKLLGSKVVTHEQTIVTGLANKVIGKFADKVFISWEESRKYFNPQKTVFTGNPIRKSVFEIEDNSLIKDIDSNLPTILVFGGNQGAHEINIRIFEIVSELVKDFNVIHQTGNSNVTKDNERSNHIKSSLPTELSKRYLPIEYISSNQIGSILNETDIMVSRSGANTVSEILALGKISILIPIPQTSHDEQIRNARLVEKVGLGIYLSQNGLTSEKLYQTILLLRNQINNGKGANNNDLEQIRSYAMELINLNASETLVNEIEKII